jgi:hypothetical protein
VSPSGGHPVLLCLWLSGLLDKLLALWYGEAWLLTRVARGCVYACVRPQ